MIGTGIDVTLKAADITIIRGDLNSIADVKLMSHKTKRNMKQNLFLAFAENVMGILLLRESVSTVGSWSCKCIQFHISCVKFPTLATSETKITI